jgi:hypothetical protein
LICSLKSGLFLRMRLLRNLQRIAQIRKRPVLEFVSQRRRADTRCDAIVEPSRECTDTQRAIVPIFLPVKRVADLIAHANACVLSRESPCRVRTLISRSALRRVTHMRVIYYRIKVGAHAKRCLALSSSQRIIPDQRRSDFVDRLAPAR